MGLIHVSILIFPSNIKYSYSMLICNVSHSFCSSQKMNLAPSVFKCLHRNKQGLVSLGLLHSNSCFSHYTGMQTFALHHQALFHLQHFQGSPSLHLFNYKKKGGQGRGKEERGKGKEERGKEGNHISFSPTNLLLLSHFNLNY